MYSNIGASRALYYKHPHCGTIPRVYREKMGGEISEKGKRCDPKKGEQQIPSTSQKKRDFVPKQWENKEKILLHKRSFLFLNFLKT